MQRHWLADGLWVFELAVPIDLGAAHGEKKRNQTSRFLGRAGQAASEDANDYSFFPFFLMRDK
jgi:hypothetical protein